MTQLAFLGGGRMAEALVRGLLDGGWPADALVVAEVEAERRRALEEAIPGVRLVPSAAWAVGDAEAVVVAVKPADVPEALGAAAASLGAGALVLSIAAGVSVAAVEALAPGRPVVRAMPNAGAVVRRGAAAIAGGSGAEENHLALAERVLGGVGTVVRVPEAQLDAVTGLSGSGPAYVFLVAEALIEAGVREGLPRTVARELVAQTVLGAGALMAEGGAPPEALRETVTSPGGTTAAGLGVLEDRAVRGAFLAAVRAAAARSRELGTPT